MTHTITRMRRWILVLMLVSLVLPAATLHEHGTIGLVPDVTSEPLPSDHPWRELGNVVNERKSDTFELLDWTSRRAWVSRLEEGPVAAAERLADEARLREASAPQPAHDVVYVSSRFGPRFHPVLKRWRPHNGVDFAAPRGTPIRAVGEGKVEHAGWLGAAGRAVVLQHDGFSSHYAHMSRVARGLRAGETVEEGEVIGYVGASGRTTGHHLHFGIKVDGEWVDPLHDGLPRIEPIEDAELAVEMERGFLEAMQGLQVRARGAIESIGGPMPGAPIEEDPFL